MFRSNPEGRGGGLASKIMRSDKGERYREHGSLLDTPDPLDSDPETNEYYRKPLDLAHGVIRHFGAPQEIEMCEYCGELYVLQSRDFHPEMEMVHEWPAMAELPDKDLPIYVIDESKKDLTTIDRELREFWLNHEEYVLWLLNASKTMLWDQDERGSEYKVKNLGYGIFLEEASVAFIPPGNHRTWGQHYEWKTDDFRCLRFYDPLNVRACILDKQIRNGICNPKKLYEVIR